MITSFEIDRATWLHGEGSLGSYLLRPSDGKMCCLGFLAKASGVSQTDLTHQKMLDYLSYYNRTLLPAELIRENSMSVARIVSLNDNPLHEKVTPLIVPELESAIEREQRLTTAFQELGITVTFTGKYKAA